MVKSDQQARDIHATIAREPRNRDVDLNSRITINKHSISVFALVKLKSDKFTA